MIPVFRDPLAEPGTMLRIAPSPRFPHGAILISMDVDPQTLLFDAQLTQADKNFLQGIKVAVL